MASDRGLAGRLGEGSGPSLWPARAPQLEADESDWLVGQGGDRRGVELTGPVSVGNEDQNACNVCFQVGQTSQQPEAPCGGHTLYNTKGCDLLRKIYRSRATKHTSGVDAVYVDVVIAASSLMVSISAT